MTATIDAISEMLIPDETVINTIARWYHSKRHKGGKAWFCESDREFAEAILTSFTNDWGWAIVEDDRSS